MRFSIRVFLPLLLIFWFQETLAETNHCNDRASWDEWNSLIEENPYDEDMQVLHALRIGLCFKIEQGSISFAMANDLFNRAYDLILEQKIAEQELPEEDYILIRYRHRRE